MHLDDLGLFAIELEILYFSKAFDWLWRNHLRPTSKWVCAVSFILCILNLSNFFIDERNELSSSNIFQRNSKKEYRSIPRKRFLWKYSTSKRVRLNYATIHHHPPSAKICPPPPTTSQNMSTTTTSQNISTTTNNFPKNGPTPHKSQNILTYNLF